MAVYRIETLGSGFAVGSEEGAVLLCRTMRAARRIVADAVRLERTPRRPIPSRASPACDEAAAEFVDVAELDDAELVWRTA